jgi:hypothetical protein
MPPVAVERGAVETTAQPRISRGDGDGAKGVTLIELTDEMREAIGNALADRAPVIVAYADSEGQPHISFRGTTQVFSKEQLALWARQPQGGIVDAIAQNPRVTLLYRNPATRLSWQFFGRAHVDGSEDVRRTVYDSSPEVERNADPERKGAAILIDVDRVVQRGQVIMER